VRHFAMSSMIRPSRAEAFQGRPVRNHAISGIIRPRRAEAFLGRCVHTLAVTIPPPACQQQHNSPKPTGSVPARFSRQFGGIAGEASMPSTRSPLRCVHRLASGDIIRPRRPEAFPRPSVRQPTVTASMRCRRAEAFYRSSVFQLASGDIIEPRIAEAFQDDSVASSRVAPVRRLCRPPAHRYDASTASQAAA
jgi:hypothetical protein